MATRERKPDRLAEVLLGQIRDGVWPAGTRLPSERQLAAEHRVSRNAVREALTALQLSGYIETRVGDGHYATQRAAPDSVDPGLRAGLSISGSLRLREALEISAVVLAIRHATRSDVLKLDAALAELTEHIEAGDYKSYLLATLDLHKLVARASHNQPLIDMVEEVTDRHRADQWLVHDQYTAEIAAYSLGLYADIVTAIRDKDVPRATDAVIRHYERYPVVVAGKGD